MSSLPVDWRLPAGWEMKPLGEVATLQRGFDLPVQDRQEGSFKIFAANGPVGTHSEPKVRGPGVITGRSGSIGKVHYVEEDYWPLNTSLWVKDFHDNDPRWVSRLLTWMRLEKFTRGVGVPTLNRNLVHEVEIPLPPLEEQKRIAGILDQADALRRLRTRALDKLNTLGQAIFHEMFGEGEALEIEIRNLGKVQTGSTPSTKVPEYFDGNVPFMTPGDLEGDGSIGRFVSEEGAANSRTVQRGATLVCCIGATIGKMGIAEQRSAFNQQINAVDWSDAVLAEYGLFAMREIRNDIIHIGKGAATTLPILKKSLFEKMKIRVAPLDRQKVFIERVHNIEAIKQTFSAALKRQETLFASLQHRAFRGEL